MKTLAINPGFTSTGIIVYENEIPLSVSNIRHSVEELSTFLEVVDQFEFRKNLVLQELENNRILFSSDVIIGRGGLARPIPGGVHEVDEAVRRDTVHAMHTYVCNLGGLIASKLVPILPGYPAFIVDPGVVDELEDIARITGPPLVPRATIWHTLNQKAIVRRFTKEQGAQYGNLDLIVCHLGSGIPVVAHHHGRATDANSALDGEGPFSPERVDTPPTSQLTGLCFSGQLTKDESKKRISRHAELTAHLGTIDVPTITQSIEEGDKGAELILDAIIYNVTKAIGASATVLREKIDAILLTGGIAYSGYVISGLEKRISFLAPIYIYPGENEMESLASNTTGALKGELPTQIYKQAGV